MPLYAEKPPQAGFPYYFLKKSGILIDCSLTLLEVVLGWIVGDGPPIGRVPAGALVPALLIAPPSIGIRLTISPEGRMDPIFCCPSSLALSLEELPPTLCKPVAITVIVASSDLESS